MVKLASHSKNSNKLKLAKSSKKLYVLVFFFFSHIDSFQVTELGFNKERFFFFFFEGK